MNNKYEKIILNINIKSFVYKLKKIGAKKLHNNLLLVRDAYFINKTSIIKLQDTGLNRVIIMTKNITRPNVIEKKIVSGDKFESCFHFLKKMGATFKSYHETLYQKWVFRHRNNLYGILINTSPYIPTFAKIICNSQRGLIKFLQYLGMKNIISGCRSIGKLYKLYYGINERCVLASNIMFNKINKKLVPKKNKYYMIKYHRLNSKMYNYFGPYY